MKELKDIIKLPFEATTSGVYVYVPSEDAKYPICVDVSIFSRLNQDDTAREKLLYAITEFATEALNEKAEREWGERKRWGYYKTAAGNMRFHCPECRCKSCVAHNYCPSCGVRLDPPEGEAL